MCAFIQRFPKKTKAPDRPVRGFRVSIKLFELRNAIRTNILSAIVDNLFCTLAEHASRLIFAKNNAVAVNIYLKRILLPNVECATHFNRQYDTPKLVYSSYDTSGLHVSIPSLLSGKATERIRPKYLQRMVKNYKSVNIYSTLYHFFGKKSTTYRELCRMFIKSS